MNLQSTKLNLQLADLVRRKSSADQFLISGRSGFWRAIGIGLLGFGVGTALGLGFYGYSFITRVTDNSELLSGAIIKALGGVQLHGVSEGTVKLEPHEIRLAKGQTIAIDSSSRLRMDPAAKVFADGELKVQAPTVTVPQNTAARSASATPSITNFTVFKSVPFQKGAILTGWIFLTSAQRVPTTQYCYYNESGENSDVSVRVNIGNDEKVEAPKTPIKAFDMATAFSKCVWFKKDQP
jgi:hypothetical protein